MCLHQFLLEEGVLLGCVRGVCAFVGRGALDLDGRGGVDGLGRGGRGWGVLQRGELDSVVEFEVEDILFLVHGGLGCKVNNNFIGHSLFIPFTQL